MPKFSFEKTVKAKRETVFEVFSNYENYKKILPQHFPSIRVRSTREKTSVVEEHVLLGQRELVIMAKHVIEKPVTHDIFVIGGDAKGSHISQQFIEVLEGTKIIVTVDLKFKGTLKISLLFSNNNFEEEYGVILDDFVMVAEN